MRPWSMRFSRPVAYAVDAGALRHVADRAPHRVRVADDVVARRRPRVPLSGLVRVASTRTVVDLPAPFGPSRPNTSPSLHGEADAVERLDLSVALAQLRDDDRRPRDRVYPRRW